MRTTNEMVERVARVIWEPFSNCSVRSVTNGPCGLGDECSCWPAALAQTRAVIEAMREPTEAMMEAGVQVLAEQYGIVGEYGAEGIAEDVFRAMADAALNEVPEDETPMRTANRTTAG